MAQTFENLIIHNKRISFVLVIGMIILISALVGVVGLYLSNAALDEVWYVFATGAMYGAGITAFFSGLSFYFGDKIIAGIVVARRVEYFEDTLLFNVVEEMAIAAGIPTPAIYVIFDESPNAFATGRDPEHAIVGITTGLRKKLNREELQAVIAHEMAHIKNYDTMLMMLVGVFAGLVVLISDFFMRSFMHGLRPKSARKKARILTSAKGNFMWTIIAVLGAIALAWLAPIIAKLMQLAVSREREYLADATAVKFCRNPRALASALKKIAMDPEPLQYSNRATEHMFIINPNPKRKLTSFKKDTIWSTHPPAIKRIARLNRLVGQYTRGK